MEVEDDDDVVSWGPLVSQMRKKARTISGFADGGPWADCGARPNRCPSALFYIFFFFPLFLFLFSNSFIFFSNLIQINSNQFVNFSKNQLNILRQ
jgi:hypothetical protein